MRKTRPPAGRTIILTGAAGGIGSLVANELFVHRGYNVVLVDKDETKLSRLADRLRQARPSGEISPVSVDITDASATETIAASFDAETLDGLINNAGVIYVGKFETMPLEAFEKVLQINLLAAARLTHQFLPQLIDNSGFLINVASGAGLMAPGGLAAYATSKFGLVGFSEALAAELRGRVRVSTICPAFVDTSIIDHGLRDDRKASTATEQGSDDLQNLVHRIGVAPEKVCKKIITAMESGGGVVPMTAFTHVVHNIRKVFPGTTNYLNHLVFRQLSNKGIFR